MSFAKALYEGDLDLLKSGLFSDMIVKCKDREWNLHKTILCSRSKWFRAALCHEFKEAATGVITLEELDPDSLNNIIHCIYTTGFLDTFSKAPAFEDVTKIYVAADFLQLDEIKSMCLSILKQHSDQFKTRNIPQYEKNSNKNGVDVSSNSVLILSQVRNVFGGVKASQVLPQHGELREMYALCVVEMGDWIYKDVEFSRQLESVPDFAVDILKMKGSLSSKY